MSNVKAYSVEDFFCLRMPAMPLQGIENLDMLTKNLSVENSEEIKELLSWFAGQDLFMEAIYASSPELYRQFIRQLKKGFNKRSKAWRMVKTMYKYYSRMCQRSTPYGLFAGVAKGDVVEERSSIVPEVAAEDRLLLSVSHNVEFITSLIRHVEPAAAKHYTTIRYYKNNTLYVLGGRAYFMEKKDRNGRGSSSLSSVEMSNYLTEILSLADYGNDGVSFADAIRVLSESGAAHEVKEDYVKGLIRAQILIPDFWPSMASSDLVGDFLRNVKEAGVADDLIESLNKEYAAFRRISRYTDVGMLRAGNSFSSGEYNEIRKRDFYRINTSCKMKACRLKREVLETIEEQSRELLEVTRPHVTTNLKAFVRSFKKKYDRDEVSLMEVLDPNFGIGYGVVNNSGISVQVPLIEGVPTFADAEEAGNGYSVSSNIFQLQSYAFHKFLGEEEVVVDIENQLSAWRKKNKGNFNKRQKVSAYLFGSLLAKGAEALDAGEFEFLATQLHYPQGARLINRFTGNNEDIARSVSSFIAKEDDNNDSILYAEVLYIPDGRYGNVNLYPSNREYQIAYSSRANFPEDKVIRLEDLFVSIVGSQVVLRSHKHNRRVVPKLTSSYDPIYGTPTLQFLSDVSYQNASRGFIWGWGPMYEQKPHLPRIKYKNIILSRERWYIGNNEFQSAEKNDKDDELVVAELREKYGLPKTVILSDGDNEMLIDLDNAVARELLLREMKKGSVLLYEYLRGPGNSIIEDEVGKKYANEVIVPLLANEVNGYSSWLRPRVSKDVVREFTPGSEWHYLKLYGGAKLIDQFVASRGAVIGEELLRQGVITKWHFIRYSDPDFHLRIRFHRAPGLTPEQWSSWHEISAKISREVSLFTGSSRAITVQSDTYVRELERYGAANIENSEQMFCHDSAAVSELMTYFNGNEGEDLRWKFALVSVDYMLEDFGLSVENKKRQITNLYHQFFTEFAGLVPEERKMVDRILRQRYRVLKNTVEEMLIPDRSNPELQPGFDIFRKRSIENCGCISQLKFENEEKRADFIASHIHMAMNRLFMVEHRKHELVVYSLLSNFYRSFVLREDKVALAHLSDDVISA